MCDGDRGLCRKAVGRQDKQLNTYDWLADVPGNAFSTDLVEVQFKHTRKGYYHNSNKLELKKGDIVAVEANPGHDIGVVTLTGRLVKKQIKKANIKSADDIKRIYRLARPVDMDKYREAKSREHGTMIQSRQIAKDLGLQMKIGDVEYQGDCNKTPLTAMTLTVGYDSVQLAVGQACLIYSQMRANVFRKHKPFVCVWQFTPAPLFPF